jgi:hypothetical protein
MDQLQTPLLHIELYGEGRWRRESRRDTVGKVAGNRVAVAAVLPRLHVYR